MEPKMLQLSQAKIDLEITAMKVFSSPAELLPYD